VFIRDNCCVLLKFFLPSFSITFSVRASLAERPPGHGGSGGWAVGGNVNAAKLQDGLDR